MMREIFDLCWSGLGKVWLVFGLLAMGKYIFFAGEALGNNLGP